MKPRRQVSWILFAFVMVWAEFIGDVPRLLLPHLTTPAHFLTAFANVTAIVGLTLYAFGRNGSRAFWRLFAPLYAMVIAAELGAGLVSLTRVLTGLMTLGKDAPLVILGGIVVLLPLTAIAVFTLIALFRLGDWIGPTRRPVGIRPRQLVLPL